MRKCKFTIYFFGGIILLLIVFSLFERHRYRSIIWDIIGERDHLLSLQYCREGKDLIYYGLTKDSVMTMLPKPEYDYITIIDSTISNYNDWKKRHFVETYIKTRHDTIEINVVQWRIPYHEIPNLYLGFIKKNGIWVVDDGMQWSDDTKID